MNTLANKVAVAKRVANKTGMSIENSKIAIDATLDAIKEIVKEEGGVCFQHFGSFRLVNLKARKQRNPQTGEIMDIPPKKKVGFSAAKGLKEYVTKDDRQSQG